MNIILNFFLRRNLAIAKQRVWEQTVASRGKGPTFWKPYVEEWDRPPVIAKPGWDAWLSGSAARFVIRRSELEFFGQSPFVGRFCPSQSPDPLSKRSPLVPRPDLSFHRYLCICVSQGARNWHISSQTCSSSPPLFSHHTLLVEVYSLERFQYFEAKGMTKVEIATFVEERKWHYRGTYSSRSRVVLRSWLNRLEWYRPSFRILCRPFGRSPHRWRLLLCVKRYRKWNAPNYPSHPRPWREWLPQVRLPG